MRTWFVSTALLLFVLYLLLHTGPAATRVQSSALAIRETNGTYSDGSRSEPTADTRLYWVDAMTGTIRRSALDGSATEIVAAEAGLPYGMAFDAAAQTLLWTDSAAETVRSVAVSGGVPKTLATAFEEPYAIDVSIETEYAFYTATANTVYRNTIDVQTGQESSIELLTLPDTETIHGLALDSEHGALYIGDGNGRMVRKFALTGKEAQPLPHTDTEVPPDSTPSGALRALEPN